MASYSTEKCFFPLRRASVGPLTAETRVGRLTLGGRVIDIEPIHKSPNLEIPTSEPLGYRFVGTNQDLGAIDLNGERKTIYAPRGGADGKQC